MRIKKLIIPAIGASVLLLFLVAVEMLFDIFRICNKNEIYTFALVVPSTFRGPILIFLEQDFQKGDIRYKNCKHYFYVKESGIFYTPAKAGEGYIEFYDDKLKKVDYYFTMDIGEAPPESFQVIGGAYRGFNIKEYKNGEVSCKFMAFTAGIAKDIKDNWNTRDSTVERLYRENLPDRYRQR